MKTNFRVVAILTALVGIFYFDVLFMGKSFISPDGDSAISLALSMQDEGFYPKHFPYIFAGMPTTLIFTPSWLYTPNLALTYLPTIVQHLLHFVFAGFGVFLLMRRWGVSVIAGLVGAVSFIFTTNMIGQEVYGHAGLHMTAAYIPWVLWAVHKQSFAWTALFVGLQLQRGHFQIAYYTWMMVGLYLIINREWIWQAIVSFALGFGFAAVKLFPVISYSGESTRSSMTMNYATDWSLHPKEMLTFIWPDAYGFGNETYHGFLSFTHFPNYLGVVVVVLALVGLRKQLFLSVALGMSLVIAFGKYTPVFGFLFDYLPLFDHFRVPMMILIITQFGIACLAGFGFDRVKNKIDWKIANHPINKKGELKRILWKISLPFLFLIVLADLWIVGYRINQPQEVNRLERRTNPVIEYLQRDKEIFRILPVDNFATNDYAAYGIESVGGYHSAKLNIFEENWRKSLHLLNIKYFIKDGKIIINPDFSPRYWLKNGEIEVLTHEREYRELKVKSNRSQKLIISEIYHSSWQVFLNGRQIEVWKYKDIISWVHIPKGEFIVEMKYVDHSIEWGIVTSVISFLVILGIGRSK